MWNSADEYLPSTTPPFAESLESTCTMLRNVRSRMNTSVITSPSPIQSTSYENANSICLANLHTLDPTCLPRKFLTTWVSHPRRSGGQHYTLRNSYVETLWHILPNIPDNGILDHQFFWYLQDIHCRFSMKDGHV
jgi:hypothetical protein